MKKLVIAIVVILSSCGNGVPVKEQIKTEQNDSQKTLVEWEYQHNIFPGAKITNTVNGIPLAFFVIAANTKEPRFLFRTYQGEFKATNLLTLIFDNKDTMKCNVVSAHSNAADIHFEKETTVLLERLLKSNKMEVVGFEIDNLSKVEFNTVGLTWPIHSNK